MAEHVKVFDVQTLSDSKAVSVVGDSLGSLRSALTQEFGMPPFEQRILYRIGSGELAVLEGDDSVLLSEKASLLSAQSLMLSRQVDPRYKLEKETAFLEALVACRFREARDILHASGVSIDPNCVHRGRITEERVAVSECPFRYTHPALTVALQAGLERAVHHRGPKHEEMHIHMSREREVLEVVTALIEMQADVNSVGDEQQDCESAGAPTVHDKSPLCAAIQRGSPALVKVLLDARADPNHEMSYDRSAWGPDRHNPLGPGRLRPESWLMVISNGFVSNRDPSDIRCAHDEEILELLRSAREGPST